MLSTIFIHTDNTVHLLGSRGAYCRGTSTVSEPPFCHQPPCTASWLCPERSKRSLAPSVGRGKLIPTTPMERTTANQHARAVEGQVEDTATFSNQRIVRHLSYNELITSRQNQQFVQNQLQQDHKDEMIRKLQEEVQELYQQRQNCCRATPLPLPPPPQPPTQEDLW